MPKCGSQREGEKEFAGRQRNIARHTAVQKKARHTAG
jgi:hypothetical protein